ncbi:MAG: formylglycine-generating enzyme required for sulfatase activity/pectate lyase [Candidatus Latescibacterota bacterium]|jgi:formylglycine-generating enzyme required for sulfatase activity/pectate lyase
MSMNLITLYFCLLLVSSCQTVSGQAIEREKLLLAFPEAEGFGASSVGGRGGRVIHVTNLEDYDPKVDVPIPGSFRAAVRAKGPRMIVFDVAGNIVLKTQMYMRNPYLTIAGQTAPGGGVCIANDRVWVATHDVIIRHLRFRSGDKNRNAAGTLYFGGTAENVIVDHCSMSWAIFITSVVGSTTRNITVQWCIISEGLSNSFHPKGEHSKGTILANDGGLSQHHNLYAHNAARNPRVNLSCLDFRNNVVYDWGYRCGYTREGPTFINFINNYFKPGPSTTGPARQDVFEPGDRYPQIFMTGNVLEGQPNKTADNRLLIETPPEGSPEGFRNEVLVDEPFLVPTMRTESAEEAYERVTSDVGATLPKRDRVDERVLAQVRTGTGQMIDSQDDVGGWPELGPAPAHVDRDADGMPDAWEERFGFDPIESTDGNTDADGDGYTNIEEYLNGTDPQVVEMDCYVDAADFRSAQQAAQTLVASGKEQWAQILARREESAAQDVLAIGDKLAVNLEGLPGSGKKPLRLTIDDAVLDMVLIPAGSFLMGSPDSEGGEPKERPQHKVNISRPFYMAVVPITQAQFRAVFGTDSRRPRADGVPAKDVTWYEAMDYCKILSAATGQKFRLPTEAEWEYACRAGTTTPFHTGETMATDQANFNGVEPTRFNPAGVNRGRVFDVDAFAPNAWGLYDMHGNEAEYCLDGAYRKYTSKEVTDPIGPENARSRVMRGGKASSKAFYCRSAYRFSYGPDIGYGFRLIMEMPRTLPDKTIGK